ncbi:Ankyrin repeat and KH domain-containing protein mask [Diplonema papillatum]|nr:Ankyrin repeat and KH domain-containing protein mask [Diplonema papillatum]
MDPGCVTVVLALTSGERVPVTVRDEDRVGVLFSAAEQATGISPDLFSLFYEDSELVEEDRDRAVGNLGFVDGEELAVSLNAKALARVELKKRGRTADAFELVRAVSAGDLWSILTMRQAGLPVDRDNRGYPLLLCPTVTPEVIKCLVSLGASVNVKDSKGRTPLHQAAMLGRTEAASVLLQLGADIHARDFDGCSPLYLALASNKTSTARALVQGGADVNAKDDKGTPLLSQFSIEGRRAIALALIDLGAEVNKDTIVTALKTCNLAIAVAQLKQKLDQFRTRGQPPSPASTRGRRA